MPCPCRCSFSYALGDTLFCSTRGSCLPYDQVKVTRDFCCKLKLLVSVQFELFEDLSELGLLKLLRAFQAVLRDSSLVSPMTSLYLTPTSTSSTVVASARADLVFYTRVASTATSIAISSFSILPVEVTQSPSSTFCMFTVAGILRSARTGPPASLYSSCNSEKYQDSTPL